MSLPVLPPDTLARLRNLFLHYSRKGGSRIARGFFSDIERSSFMFEIDKWLTFCKELKVLSDINRRQARMVFFRASQG
jgi:hypothetical protein